MTTIITIGQLHSYILAQGHQCKRDGNTLSAGGGLDLSSLTTLPEGVTLFAGGGINLHSLTTLPEGVTLSTGGWLYLPSLTTETQTYHGTAIRLKMVDGYCMRLLQKRRIGGVVVWSAHYFRGSLDVDQRCYVAQDGDIYAHGTTVETALRDLRFTGAERDFDADELRADILARGTVSFTDYRLITGACESGLIEGLRNLGKEGVESLPLSEAMALCDGQYGGATFRKFMETTA